MKGILKKGVLSVKRFGIFIIKNPLYVLWFLVFFTISFLTIASNTNISNRSAFIICLVLYFISIPMALIFGEPILKVLNGVRPVETKQEKEYLTPIFESVLNEVLERHLHLSEIKLHIIDTININAKAIGSHTVAVTKGAIEFFSEEELKSIILHEIAHIYNGDTKALIINKVGNGFLSVYIVFVNIFFRTLDFLFIDLDDSDTTHLSGLFRALFLFIRLSANLTVYLILMTGNIILSKNSRKNELEADRFVFNLGYGEELKSALYLMQKISMSENLKLVDKIQQSHPRISKRIEQLESLLDADMCYEN
ncbi:MAG: M48 family metalloprotease [Fibrobacter sp.]|nr:M48 family metalloprotease [Fibrobacter sp.]